MNPRLRTRTSKGKIGVGICTANLLLKMIAFLNQVESATITEIVKIVGNQNNKVKAGLAFLRGIKIIEKVYNPHYKNRNRQLSVYRLNKTFKKLYNNFPEKTELEKEVETKYKKFDLYNKDVELRVISRARGLFSLSLPREFTNKNKLKKGDVIKLKPLEILRLTKIKEF